MPDKAFKLVFLCLFLLLSGYCICRLAVGLLDAWASGRFATGDKRDPAVAKRIVRSHQRPIEFWFTMAVWHGVLVAFTCGFGWGLYGVWRVAVGP